MHVTFLSYFLPLLFHKEMRCGCFLIYIIIIACKILMIKYYERFDHFLLRGRRDINEKGQIVSTHRL